MKARVLSGMRPSGKLHIGHLFGVLQNWRKLQEEYECYFEVADYHALTTEWENTRELRENIRDMVLDWLAVGIDPDRAVLFVQSRVREHAELHLIFSMLVTLSRLLRVPTFKEHVADLKAAELRGTKKRVLDATADRAVGAFLERMSRELKPERLGDPEYRHLLKVRLKDAVIEGLMQAFGEEEEELSYGHLVNYGFLGYPVLQAADILVYRADLVPIGEDQLPHLELTREIARRFNKLYGKVFPEPQPLLTSYARIPGTDNRKMSKRYKNTILISEKPEDLRAKVARMYTDPEKVRKNDPGHPERCPVYTYHTIFNPEGAETVARECRGGLRGCVACKREVAEKMVAYLAPIQARREELARSPQIVEDILEEGQQKASEVTSETMARVRDAMGMW